MDKAYEEFLDKYIPSADVRARIIETDHQFSDWDRAAIIWNSDIPLQDKHAEIYQAILLSKCKLSVFETEITANSSKIIRLKQKSGLHEKFLCYTLGLSRHFNGLIYDRF